MEQPRFIYDLDDRPPLRHAVIYALQWAVILFPTLITAAALMAGVLHLSPAQEVRFLQLTLLTSGIFTTVQCLWGHRYPILEGPSTALLLTFLVLAPYGMPAIQGGTLVGGLLLTIAVILVKPKRIIYIMTPNVVGVILMLIALTLLPFLSRLLTGADTAGGVEVSKFLFSIAVVLVIAAMAYRLEGFLKSVSLLLGMIVGTACFFIIEIPSLKHLLSASWFSFPQPLVPSRPEFTVPAVIAFAVSYVAVVINSIGSIQGIANITSRDRLQQAIPRGLFINGIGGVVCGLMGVIGTVSYSISPGVVLSNRVASRYAAAYCGVLLLLSALVPKLAALLSLVPPPVVGAALCAAMGVQIGAALAIIAEKGIQRRDYAVVGLPVLMGTLTGFLPQGLIEAVPQVLRVFIGNGLIFGILLVLILEHIIMREKRGVEPPGGNRH